MKVVCNAAGSVQVLFQAVMGLRQHSPQVKPLGCVPIHDGLSFDLQLADTYITGDNCFNYVYGLQHKGAMSTKPVFEKIAKIQRSYVPLCGHTTFVLLIPARTRTIIDKIFCNDVNKTSTSVELLAINILCYIS